MKDLLKKVVLTTLSVALMQTALQAQETPIEIQNETYIPHNTSEAESPSLLKNLRNKAESKLDALEENLEEDIETATPKVKNFYQRHKTLINTLATVAITTAVVIIGFKFISPLRNKVFQKEIRSAAKDKIEDRNSVITRLSRQLDQEKGTIVTKTTTITEISGQLDQANTQINRLQGELGQANTQINRLQGELGQAIPQINTLQGELGQAKTQINRLQGELGQAIPQINTLQGELGQAKTQIVALQNIANGSKYFLVKFDDKLPLSDEERKSLPTLLQSIENLNLNN